MFFNPNREIEKYKFKNGKLVEKSIISPAIELKKTQQTEEKITYYSPVIPDFNNDDLPEKNISVQSDDIQISLRTIMQMLKETIPVFGDFIKLFKDGKSTDFNKLLCQLDPVLKNFLLHHINNKPERIVCCDDSLKDILTGILELEEEEFKKVDLTKTFQKKYKADEIKNVLSELVKRKCIELIQIKKEKRPGRNPSPNYSINRHLSEKFLEELTGS